MKTLGDIIRSISHRLISGNYDQPVSSIEIDSRKITEGSMFVAIQGSTMDGHQFIDQSIQLGAKVIVCQKAPSHLDQKVTYVEVENTSVAAGLVASEFYDNPSDRMQVVGVTGTNGKTSIVYLLTDLFTRLGHRVGMLSTVNNLIAGVPQTSSLTTPDPVSLQKLLFEMVEAGCKYAFMEVSSHAIHQHRIQGIRFAGGVFSNLSHDHLDYHGSFKEYIWVKKTFFDHLNKSAFALVNLDDRNGLVMLQNTRASQFTFALQKSASFKGKILSNEATGLHLILDGVELYTALVGAFNASNLLAVYAVGRIFELDQMQLLEAISQVSPPPGRLESIRDERKKILAFVDYAHTPDALKNVLETIQKIKNKGSEVTTVVGCGGNRDQAKRPEMSRVACTYSDRVILTSDNPRDEDPAFILEQMIAGVPSGKRDSVLTIENRREAIKAAYMMTPQNGIILIAGKGHENYQEIEGKRYPFDDKEVIRACFS